MVVERRPPMTLRDLRAIPVSKLTGVGPAIEDRLATMGIETVLDVLTHYPRRYLDRTKRSDIAGLAVGEEATVFGEVRKASSRRTRNGKVMVEISVTDGDSFLACTFFNQAWREKQLAIGTEAAFFGKLEVFNGKRQMTNPVVDVIGRAGQSEDLTGVVVPIYPQSGKADIYTWQLRKIMSEVMRRCAERSLSDPLSESLLDELDMVDRWTAHLGIHQPESMAEVQAARRRLIFDEFFRMQLGLIGRKRAQEARQLGIVHSLSGELVAQFHERLPFQMTGDQARANAEIATDLARRAPMHRLLQGDVGSGKTVVALTMLLHTIQDGYQGALMAPTEVLAEQHWLSARAMLAGMTVERDAGLFSQRPLGIALLTNRTTAAERREMARGVSDGSIDLVVGTHALLYDTLSFAKLGAIVIDEQHRFGVEQRALLRDKGHEDALPDVLVMTATPIPRTAAMLIYGDLDRSELREMPPGRTPITTEVVGEDSMDRERAYTRLREQIAHGRQAYLVCPLVDGSEKIEAKAVKEEFERLQYEDLNGLRLGLLHGQMKSAEKESVMHEFRTGNIDVLVATTVIEVGVDVPNATVMIIEDADRFGLSQLHQLRGRVGRGGGESWCFLFADPDTDDGTARMEAMVESTDGFFLAERDLEIRGSGEIFGERQSGISDLKLARIPRDEPMVIVAREIAGRVLDDDPSLQRSPGLAHEVEDLLGEDVEFLFKN